MRVVLDQHLLDATSVLVRYTLAGDATLDGVVDFNDLVNLARITTSPTASRGWSGGDFTYDGVTDFNDLVKLAQNYNTSLSPAAAAAVPGAPVGFGADVAAAFARVPEPGGVGMVLLATARSGRRRRRRG